MQCGSGHTGHDRCTGTTAARGTTICFVSSNHITHVRKDNCSSDGHTRLSAAVLALQKVSAAWCAVCTHCVRQPPAVTTPRAPMQAHSVKLRQHVGKCIRVRQGAVRVRAVAAPASAAQQTMAGAKGSQLQFMKYQGLGNDFILVRFDRCVSFILLSVAAWHMCRGALPCICGTRHNAARQQ